MPVKSSLLVVFGVLAVLVPRLPAQTPAPAKAQVEVQVVAPFDASTAPGSQYSVSPHGVHVGMMVSQGSRVAVSVDGVVGPKFDVILDINSRDKVSFSPDGSRYAYVGRQGQDLVVIVDGKEALRLPAAITTAPPLSIPNPGFSADGKHSFVYLYTNKSSSSGQNWYTLYIDGVPGPNSRDDITPTFSHDGSHVAYIVTDLMNSQKTALVIDGKLAGYPPIGMINGLNGGEAPAFTADGAHLFVSAKTVPPGAMQLLVDGRPFIKAPDAHVYTAPVGSGFITRIVGPDRVNFLDIGGKKVLGSEARLIDSVVFSADGKHWAAKLQTPTNTTVVIADGKRGLEYQSVLELGFSADGRVIYHAMNGGKNFLVTGDQESDGWQLLSPVGADVRGSLLWSAAGARVGFIGITNGNMAAVVDGKPIPRRGVEGLSFSPDGSRFAFAFQGGLDVDGVDDASAMPAAFTRVPHGGFNAQPGKFLFSPDSKHIAWFGQVPAANAWGVHLDGKFFPVWSNGAIAPAFTPDSRHLFWIDHAQNENKFVVYLDGKEVTRFDFAGMTTTHSDWFEVGADGVLTLVVPDQGSVKRIRVTPGSDTSIETMLAAAKKP